MSRLKAFESRDFTEQVSVLGALAAGKDYESIPDLIGLVEKFSRHEAVGMVIRDTLKTLLSGSEDQTVRHLASGNAEVRMICIETAGQKKFADAVPLLTSLVKQADDERQTGLLFTLISALSQIRPEESAPLFRAYMNHEDSLISSMCIDALGMLHDVSSLDRLCRIVSDAESDACFSDCDLPTASAIKAVGAIRTQEAVSFLVSKVHHRNPTARRLIHHELVEIGAPAVGLLAGIFRGHDNDSKIMSANVLGFIGTREAGEALVRALDKGLATHPNIRFAVYEALGRTSGMTGLVCLVDGLEETDRMVLLSVMSSVDLRLNPWILDRIEEHIGKDANRGNDLIRSVIISRSLNIFEGLYLKDEKIASRLMEEIVRADDDETVALFQEALKRMDSEHSRADMQALGKIGARKAKARILAVDDSRAMLSFYRAAAVSMGLGIWTAANGKEAVDMLAGKEEGILLIITDMNMPVMDGIEFTRQVRNNPALKDIPVIMATTESEASQEDLARTAGADDFLRKPFSAERLKEAIESYL